MKKLLLTLLLSALLSLTACGAKVDISKLTPSGHSVGEYALYCDAERVYAVDSENRVKLSFDGDFSVLKRTGFYFFNNSTGNILTDASLEPLVDFKIGDCVENSSGQVVFMPHDKPAHQWYVTDSSGEIRPSPIFDEVIGVANVFTAVRDGGNLCIMTLDGEPIADLGEMPEGLYLREIFYLSSKPNDESVLPSYYVRFSDSPDVEAETMWLTYKYDPNTDEITSKESVAGLIYGSP